MQTCVINVTIFLNPESNSQNISANTKMYQMLTCVTKVRIFFNTNQNWFYISVNTERLVTLVAFTFKGFPVVGPAPGRA